MVCQSCGSQIIDGEKYCIKCGNSLISGGQYCIFCGKKLRDGARFCSQCGKKQISANDSKRVLSVNSLKNKKVLAMLFLLLAVIVIIVICVNSLPKNAIVGVWMNGTDKITFSSDGDFKINDGTYGTYTVDENSRLVMQSGEYSYYSGRWQYQYGFLAKENKNYWYIEGGKLYFRGKAYTKQ